MRTAQRVVQAPASTMLPLSVTSIMSTAREPRIKVLIWCDYSTLYSPAYPASLWWIDDATAPRQARKYLENQTFYRS